MWLAYRYGRSGKKFCYYPPPPPTESARLTTIPENFCYYPPPHRMWSGPPEITENWPPPKKNPGYAVGLIPTNSITLQTCWSRIKTLRLRSRSATNHRSVTGRGQVIIACRHWHTVKSFIMIHMLFSSLIECYYRWRCLGIACSKGMGNLLFTCWRSIVDPLARPDVTPSKQHGVRGSTSRKYRAPHRLVQGKCRRLTTTSSCICIRNVNVFTS